MFSKLDIDDERDREKDVSNLSTRPVVRIQCELVVEKAHEKKRVKKFIQIRHRLGNVSNELVRNVGVWCARQRIYMLLFAVSGVNVAYIIQSKQ